MNQKQKIIERYNEKVYGLYISLATSFIGGIISAISIAIILDQHPSEIYKHFGTPLYIWGALLLVLFFLFFGIFWFYLYLSKERALKNIKL